MTPKELKERVQAAETREAKARTVLAEAKAEVINAAIWLSGVERCWQEGRLTRVDLAEAQARVAQSRERLAQARADHAAAAQEHISARHALSDAKVAAEQAKREKWAATHAPEALAALVSARERLATMRSGYEWHGVYKSYLQAQGDFAAACEAAPV